VTLDDVINLHDTDGAASYPTDVLAFDWFGLESLYRGWGKDGTAFASLSNQGLWVSGTGRIWDWTLQLSDTLLKNVFAVPTGADTLTHTWSDASSTTFLQHALEISGDAIGNDDLLCETNETCLYTPNLSSYQGHSAIIPGPTFSNGTISGVTLKQYGVNGN
ncbi:MAG: hypothetical protein OEX00_04700, partial [Gammaproteobacteria bacterium]|nr:hypothetical protein [Gammaproteobacteria bacterium]